MFPFHTWLPDAHVQAPTAGSVILAGVLLKMGTYGFLRFSLPMLPGALAQPMNLLVWHPTVLQFVATLSIIGIVYAALVTLVQKDMKKLIAYSSVSHLGFCMLGMFALNSWGLEGSVLQMLNHGLSTGGLFLIVGMIYERRHTKEIAQFGGLAHVMPVYAALTLIVFLASMGLPLLNGFIGEFMILQGAFAANRVWAYWAVSGVVLGAAYLLWLYQRVFWGQVTNEENKHLSDLNLREVVTLAPLIALCFWIGVYPKPVLAFLHVPLEKIASTVQAGSSATVRTAGGTAPVHATGTSTVGERSEAVTVRPAEPVSGAVAPPERAEAVTVTPSPAPAPAH
jgi:NADH-quinone oxidoreductase subunit M